MINEAVTTRTGKIQSSRRIVKTLQRVLDSQQGMNFSFDDGTQATIEPSLAKRALDHYSNLSPFEQAKTAKYMRFSFKNFLQIAREQK